MEKNTSEVYLEKLVNSAQIIKRKNVYDAKRFYESGDSSVCNGISPVYQQSRGIPSSRQSEPT
jgi:hypothetical protein